MPISIHPKTYQEAAAAAAANLNGCFCEFVEPKCFEMFRGYLR
jgi:hypothetical protein